MLVQASDDLDSWRKMLLEPVSMSGGFLFLGAANAGVPRPMVVLRTLT
jgi:hypothetical protein